MNLSMLILAVIGIAVMVVGSIEWLKGAWKAIFKVELAGWVPSVLPPLLCLVFAWITSPLVGLAGLWFLAVALLALAVTELCYQLIVQSIPQAVAGAISGLTGQTPPKTP